MIQIPCTKIATCRKCKQKYHYAEHNGKPWFIYSKNNEMKNCPSCYSKIWKCHNNIHRKHFKVRKVRTDKKSIEHHRKVTNNRVKKWRAKQKEKIGIETG